MQKDPEKPEKAQLKASARTQKPTGRKRMSHDTDSSHT